MPNNDYFIAGDWGTSQLRLYLCRRDGDLAELRARVDGPGIRAVEGDFEHTFFQLAESWLQQYGPMPVILSGMIGSNIGWHEAPYISCPASAAQIAQGRLSISVRGLDIAILAGLKTTNPLGNVDVMRGEELQLLGWMQLNAQHSTKLLALPGTHNKWALIEGGKISNFLTAFTGELFALLRNHSILINDQGAIDFDRESFIDGVTASTRQKDTQLLHTLFSVRSRVVLGEMNDEKSLSYLSGLITAADIIGASNCYADVASVAVIGEAVLAEQYLLALEQLGIPAQSHDPEQIAIAGFNAVYQAIYC